MEAFLTAETRRRREEIGTFDSLAFLAQAFTAEKATEKVAGCWLLVASEEGGPRLH
jgi:hypothetical protein